MMHRLLLLPLCLLLAAACSHHRSTVKATADTTRTRECFEALRSIKADTLATRAAQHDTAHTTVQGMIVNRGADTVLWTVTTQTTRAAHQWQHAATSATEAAATIHRTDESVQATGATVTAEHKPSLKSAVRWGILIGVIGTMIVVLIFFKTRQE